MHDFPPDTTSQRMGKSHAFVFLMALVLYWAHKSSARSPVNMLTSVCDRKWELIYTHDEYGNATFGNKKELIKLALNGNYVRARLYLPDHMLHLPADSLSKYKDQVIHSSYKIRKTIP
ncbi:hypothetical protein PoB_002306600 [Plakobranchus ocellatus]|uniref:Uncharacterized protein n=1 Tax=Plakobranchus ocellatus TaxID=259542 RepID=A0AAV3ZBB9_9GAST|nr:hypothetical protein PoB_002306600 [Plakobranchus ocellatus]